MAWALGVVAIIAALGIVLWAAGQLAGLLTHGRWPDVPLQSAPGLAIRVPGHLGDPSQAWPSEARDQQAGPFVLYFVVLIIFALLMLIFLAASNFWGTYVASRIRRERDRSTTWARPSQIRPLIVRKVPAGRVVLGRMGHRLVAAEPRRSVLVVAPTQAGKTTRFVIPTVLRWTGPMVVTSVKSDVLRLTLAERQRRGPAYVFDPTGATGIGCVKWSPLLTCLTYPAAERTAAWLIEAAGDPWGQNAKFFESLAGKLLAPLLFAAAGTNRGVRELSTWVDRREVPQVSDALKQLGDADALDAWAATCVREERQRDSVYGTAETILSAFSSPSVRAATELSPDDHKAGRVLDARRLLSEAGTLYLIAPEHEQARLRPLFESLVQEVIRAAQDKYTASGTPLDPSLMLMLDEAANIAPLRELATYASTGAGQGIQICSIWQDLAQVEAIYGRRAATVVNGHTARVFLAGSADFSTLDTTSRMIGEHETHRASVSHLSDGQRSIQESTTETRLAPVDYLRQVAPDAAVVLYGRAPVIRLKTTAWYDDPALRRLVPADSVSFAAADDTPPDRPAPTTAVDGHPQITAPAVADVIAPVPTGPEEEPNGPAVSDQVAPTRRRFSVNPIGLIHDATRALNSPAVPRQAIMLVWDAAELGEEAALYLLHNGPVEDTPAYLTAADRFASVRRDLDEQVDPEQAPGTSLADEPGEESPDAVDIEVALVHLARSMVAALTDAARRSGDADVVLACSKASLAAANAGEACTRARSV
jgi:type IV secretion system protein VirD4